MPLMKYCLLILLTLFCATDASIPEMHPNLGDLVTKSPIEAVRTAAAYHSDYPKLLEDMRTSTNFDHLSQNKQTRYQHCQEALKVKPQWAITFEIIEVYKGDRYADTAITEIYFDGIGVHEIINSNI